MHTKLITISFKTIDKVFDLINIIINLEKYKRIKERNYALKILRNCKVEFFKHASKIEKKADICELCILQIENKFCWIKIEQVKEVKKGNENNLHSIFVVVLFRSTKKGYGE